MPKSDQNENAAINSISASVLLALQLSNSCGKYRILYQLCQHQKRIWRGQMRKVQTLSKVNGSEIQNEAQWTFGSWPGSLITKPSWRMERIKRNRYTFRTNKKKTDETDCPHTEQYGMLSVNPPSIHTYLVRYRYYRLKLIKRWKKNT